MRSKINANSYKGHNIYVGIDSHLKSWKVSIMVEQQFHKSYCQNPEAELLKEYLHRNFPGGSYFSAYEASFCGFSIHRNLEKCGIKNIVVNPADIPTTDKEKRQKEDRRDSLKIVKMLSSNNLEGIYIPSVEIEELRSLVRYRKTLVKEVARNKGRIKSFLHYYGIKIPNELNSASKYWSGRFTQWLATVTTNTEHGKKVLDDLIDLTLVLRQKLLVVTKELKQVAKVKYPKLYNVLISIPGIANITAITIISELENIKRFKNLDRLCSYVGLVPSTNSSGEKERTGNITNRSNFILRACIIESAWIAARKDPALILAFNKLCNRMEPNKAIVRIAKKLLNRIRYTLLNEKEYEIAIVQ